MRQALLGCALLLCVGAGCHREYVIYDPLTADEIVDLSRQGVPADEIRRRIDQSGTVYLLDSRDILELAERGVDPDVIEHMRQTRERQVERRVRYYYAHPPLYYHYWWPYGYHFGIHSHWWW